MKLIKNIDKGGGVMELKVFEKIRDELDIDELISKTGRITIKEVKGEPRITLIRELKDANINKGDTVITFVPCEGVIVVVKKNGV